MQLTVKQDWSMADLLGNHQRVDRLLRHRNRYVILLPNPVQSYL
jgi:hypothetical protein